MNFKETLSNTVPGFRIQLFEEIINEKGLLGTAEIVEFVGDPISEQTFIRKDMPSNKQEVWAPRKALLRITSLTKEGEGFNLVLGKEYVRDIAYPYRVGNTPCGWYDQAKHKDKNLPSFLVDTFISVNGVECY